MSKSITGVANTGSVFITGSLELNELKVPTIYNKRIEQNKIELYNDDVVYSSKSDYTINYNDGNLGTNPIFNIKKNNVEKMVINDSGLDVKSGELFYNGTALKSFTETLINKSIDCNNNTLTNVPTSALSGVVLTTTDQTIAGNKTFSSTINGNANTATTLQTQRTIGGQPFNGSQNVSLTTASLTDNNNIMLKDADQTITGSNTFDNTIIGSINGSSGSCSGNALTATTLATARSIAGEDFDGGSNISLSSSNLTNTDKILLTDATQTITSRKNYIGGNAKLAMGPTQPTTLPGVINCNGKLYIDGGTPEGITIARADLYDHSNGNAGLTKREWNINCPTSNNKLRFNFLQQTEGGAITNEDVVQFSSSGIETALITTDKIQQTAGNLTIETENSMIFEVDNNNNGLANKYSFTDDGEEMVKIFRSSSNGVEHAMSKSYLSAEGYIRAENSIIRNSNGIVNLGFMLGVSSNTDSSEAGELRFNRYDPDGPENIRYHSIKSNCSATSTTNSMKFFIHDATTTTSQSAIMLLTPITALIYGTISVLGLCEFVSGAISANNNGFKYNNISGASNTTFAFKIASNRVKCRINNAQEINISNTFSDIRLKSDIVECEDTTDIINKIQVKKYTFGDTEFSKNNSFGFTKVENEVGIIADELMEVIPEAVQNKEEDEIKTIEYDVIIPYLIKNLQQNNKIITELNKKVEELEETILGLMDT